MNELEFIRSLREQCDNFLKSQDVKVTTVTDDITITSPQTITGTIFEGAVTVTAPDVTFDNCKFPSKRNEIILWTSHRTKVINCDLVGNDIGGQHKGIFTNDSVGVRIINSRVKNIWNDIDTCAVGAYSGCKDLQVINSELEASGENVLFGGATISKKEDQCSDIVIKGCKIYKNPVWKNKIRGETCKNLIEIKSGVRILIAYNECTYSWEDGQQGYAVVITTRQDPSPWASIEDLEITDNKFSSVGAGIEILGWDDTSDNPDDGHVKNMLLARNEFYLNPSAYGGSGRQVYIVKGSENLSIIANKFHGEGLNSAFYFARPERLSKGLVIKDNEMEQGMYGIVGDDAPSLGKAVLEMYAPGYVWENNKINNKDNPYVIWPE